MNIVDVLAGAALVIGSLLVALGAFGLLRFPDVFTRMHAATKAATVGVIGTTAAAAVEVGAVGGVMVLLLVVALLFLSGPLGMSLLARAAYHDPETPMWKNTRELPTELPIPESTPSRRGRGTSPYLGLWLFAIWVAAFGSLAPNVLVGGMIIAGVLAVALRHLAPRWPRAVLHPIAVLRFTGHFIAQLVVSTWDVIKALRLSPEEIRPAIVEIPLRVRTRTEVTLLMNSISFTPGTVALELHGRNLYVHVLTTDDPSAVVADVEAMEDAVMAAVSGTPTPAASEPQA